MIKNILSNPINYILSEKQIETSRVLELHSLGALYSIRTLFNHSGSGKIQSFTLINKKRKMEENK
jgi:hypothetical protein